MKPSVGVPKATPRQKWSVKNPPQLDFDGNGDQISIYSSEESSSNCKAKKEVVVEVHSSRTHLLQSSSDDDILAEKKTKKRKKKSRWKQASESVQLMKEKELENEGFQMEEDIIEKSFSSPSNRSFIVETPTFPIEKLKSLGTEGTKEIFKVKNARVNDDSPSRLSNKSYVIEVQSSPQRNFKSLVKKNDIEDKNSTLFSPSRLSDKSHTLESPIVLADSMLKSNSAKSKTPVPLPRRKSLKSLEINEGQNQERLADKIDVSNLEYGDKNSDTLIEINETKPYDNNNLKTLKTDKKFLGAASQHTEEEGEELLLAVRKQKRKKKKRKKSKSREEIELQEFTVSNDVEDHELRAEEAQSTPSVNSLLKTAERRGATKSNDCIVGVTIHGVDCPLIDPLVRHPVVCFYVVDTSVGELYRKSDPKRDVCYQRESTQYIQPIMTHLFDLKLRRSLTPFWEELLLLNEVSSHLFTPSTLLLFELCDFVPASLASARCARVGSTAGRYTIAWAFLRPKAKGGILQDTKRLRLQLYKPGKQPKSVRPLTPVIYEWWGSASRHKFPGCLYVTVTELDAPSHPPSPKLRSQSVLQEEQGSKTSVASASVADSDSDNKDQNQETEKPSQVVWTRLPAQSCKLPNSRLFSLPVDGSMCLQFSGNGLWLACGRQDIQVYSVPHYQLTATLTGHQGLVYCLRWSGDSKILLSASADCTVCIWKPISSRNPLLQMLAHPSFVYCALFMKCYILVSGCYDSVVRVWKGESHTSYKLVQELPGHSGFVSSICATIDGSKIISSDSQGSLRIYDVEENGSLSIGRELRVREVRGVMINNVIAHPGGHRILVHSRDSTVRSVDFGTGAVIQTFKGCSNDRLQTGVCVSACGSLVFACGEDGAVVAWDGHTGSLRAIYSDLLPPGSASVHYHPYDHMMAVGSLNQPPVYILMFNRHATGEDIGLNIIKNDITAADVIEKMKLLKNSNKWQKAASKIIHNSHRPVIQDRGNGKEKGKRDDKNSEENEKQIPDTNWPSLPQLECFLEKSSGEKDLRLLGIIRKMDEIILAAKQSSQSQ